MDNIKKLYSDAFQVHGDSAASVLCPKGRQNLRFSKLLAHVDMKQTFSILDFGSGLSHLIDYLDECGADYDYTGVDICEEFLEHCRSKYSNRKARFINLQTFQSDAKKYDHTICVGTFNLKYHANDNENKIFVMESIQGLFAKSLKSLCLNFMTSEVDFIQEGAFHVSPLEFWDYSKKNLSKRILIDSTFMPYEFNAILHKDDHIKRPENIYEI